MTIKITHSSANFPEFLESLYVGMNIYEAEGEIEGWWPVVFGAAVLVASLVDYYCDSQIAAGVALCTQNSFCSVVNTCSATCVTCP